MRTTTVTPHDTPPLIPLLNWLGVEHENYFSINKYCLNENPGRIRNSI